VRLEAIENLFDTLAMKAVEQSKFMIGVDLPDDQRQSLIRAVWDNCLDGRNFRFNEYDIPMGKTNFYERRREFLYNIAQKMELI
jgi:hypothetical protein